MSSDLMRPASNSDREAWTTYWAMRGTPWRTEPEIDEARQTYLEQCRSILPNWRREIFRFKGVRLSRADVEWLLVTHDGGDWLTKAKALGQDRFERGIDLRGADLSLDDLRFLPLNGALAGLDSNAWFVASEEQREAAAVHLEGANLSRCSLQDASLRGAHLEGANLTYTFLEGSTIRSAHLGGKLFVVHNETSDATNADTTVSLEPANLRNTILDDRTALDDVELGDREHGYVQIADLLWRGANLTVVDWSQMPILGDEQHARSSKRHDDLAANKAIKLRDLRRASRAYKQLAMILSDQGMGDEANPYWYRAKLVRRTVLRLQGQWVRAFGSWLLDVAAGYGYRPIRSVVTYLVVVLSFAACYFALTNFAMVSLLQSNSSPLAWYEAVVLSISSFHGRGLFPSGLSLGDPVAILAAGEAIIGLLIEIIFIATFTQRFFSR